MSNINTRIYGAPIPKKVQEVLEQRQAVAGNSQPNQSIESLGKINFPTTSGGSVTDLSSRTPFARMWVAVEIHDSGVGAVRRVYDVEDADIRSAKMIGAMEAFAKKMGKDDYTEVYHDPEKNKFYVYSSAPTDNETKVERKIYTVGNHVINTEAVTPNQQRKSMYSSILPSEHEVLKDNNRFLKPQAGITSINSSTKSASSVMAGALKETTINFVVHNFHDFDKIYNKFFLKPGARIFLDFGWDVNDLYDIKPEDMEDIQNKIYQRGGYLDSARGNMETLMGVVINYDARILPNGSVECSITIISKNEALSTYDVGNSKEKIDFILNNLIYFDGLLRSVDLKIQNGIIDGDKFGYDKVLEYLEDDTNTTTDQVDKIEGWLTSLTDEWWDSSTEFVPGANPQEDASLDSGVFTVKSKTTYEYIQFGKFEDFILNSEFGFGDSKADINNPQHSNFESSFDSKNSYVNYVETLYQNQKRLSSNGEGDTPIFLYPETWFYINVEESRTPYNVQVGKTPDIDNNGELESISSKSSSERISYYNEDKKAKRIPIRELFIRKDIIHNSFVTGKSLLGVLESLLETINEYAQGNIDLAIAPIPGDDTGFSIIDRLLPPEKCAFAKTIGSSPQVIENPVGDNLGKLFEFDVMGKNSIVTNYDLSFKLPSDKLSAMIAIEGGSPLSQTKITSTEYADLQSTKNLFDKVDDENQSSLFVKHLPLIGDEQTNKEDKNITQRSEYKRMYESAIEGIQSDMISRGKNNHSTNYFSKNVSEFRDIKTYYEDLTSYTSPRNLDLVEEDEQVEIAKSFTTLREEKYVQNGNFVASDNASYLQAQMVRERTEERVPITPIYLTLSIYGISSIQPGDIFKVNYLPEIYRNNVYFQTIKVSHQISTSGWSTTLETIMRISPKTQKNNLGAKQYKDVFFTANYVYDGLGVTIDSSEDGFPGLRRPFNLSQATPLEVLSSWVTKLKPVDGGVDYSFIQKQLMKDRPGYYGQFREPQFQTTNEWSGKPEGGPCKNPINTIELGKVRPEPKSTTKKWKAYSFFVTEQGQGKQVIFPPFRGESSFESYYGVYHQFPTYTDLIEKDDMGGETEWKSWFISPKGTDWVKGYNANANPGPKHNYLNQIPNGYADYPYIVAKYGHAYGGGSDVDLEYPGGYHYSNGSGEYVPSIVLWHHDPNEKAFIGDGHKYYMCLHPDYEDRFYTIIRAD